MRTLYKIALSALVLAASLQSCEFISNLIHDDEVVAKLGRRELYRSQLSGFIPSGLSAEDSTNLATQYINSWASELLFADIATEQLSKSEQDLTAELEDYRRSLLKYRFEQRYVNERLDTAVSRNDISEYYHNHSDIFILEVPIVKARFLDIMQESPNLEVLKEKMSSNDPMDLVEADSLAYHSALRYEDKSDVWQDMVSFSRYFGTDYGTVLSMLKGGFIEMPDERGDVKIAYVCSLQRAGTPAPIEYCTERIRDIIISARKQALLSTLEQELLKDALDKQNLIIYHDEK